MAYMYGGTILRVNLSDANISKEPTAPYADTFVGGRGINAKLLYDGAPPEISPLDPGNLLIFGVGPLCGTPVPASRVEVTSKSPVTGFLGSSNFGGFFGPELKFAGYDNIVITGRADKPVYIWIDNERVEIRDASRIWGKDTYETQAIIRSEVDPEAQIACIGQAGENLVVFATVQHGLGDGAGRTGMGAVMGSKNLKAIAVRGTKGLTLADPETYLSIADELHQELRNDPQVQEIQQCGMSKAQDEARFLLWDPDWKEVRAGDIVSKYKPRRTGCFGCPQQCKDLYRGEVKGGGVLYCTFYSAPLFPVRNTDLELMLESGFQIQRYGIDNLSFFVIMAWLMELYERGIISAKDTDGISMEWGSRQAILGMLRKVVFREGFGDLLADGVLAAAERIGRGAKDYAHQVKGLPVDSVYTPNRVIPLKGEALALAVGSRGDSMRAGVLIEYAQVFKGLRLKFDEKTAAEKAAAIRKRLKQITGTEKAADHEEYEGKPELVTYIEDGIIIDDCLSFCKFHGGSKSSPPVRKSQLPALLSAGIGVETSEDILFKLAKRVRNLERAYDAREGLTRDADSLPKRWMDRPIERGDFKGSVLESGKFEQMKSNYYALRGWDITIGIPTKKALKQSGLADVADDLEKGGNYST